MDPGMNKTQNPLSYYLRTLQVHLELVLDYKLLEEHRKRLSSLLGLLELLAPLFSMDFSKDELHQSLRVCHERLEREWETQNLANTTVSSHSSFAITHYLS